MRFTKTLAAAAVIAVAGSASFAGAPTPPIADDIIEIVPPAPQPAGSSIPAGYIVLGLLAALVAASGSF